MVTGFHSIVYSDDPGATRNFFREVLHWPHLDAGGGWLIFKTPPSELGVHPLSDDGHHEWAPAGTHAVSLMCGDIEATVADLRAKGVDVDGDTLDRGFGLVTSIAVPGAGRLMRYEPRHELAHQLDG